MSGVSEKSLGVSTLQDSQQCQYRSQKKQIRKTRASEGEFIRHDSVSQLLVIARNFMVSWEAVTS